MAGSVDSGGDDDDVIATINIVPFVDIVLVVLIIFMVTSTAIARASLKVDLPQAASGGAAVESTMNLVYAADGTVYLNGEPSTFDAIAAAVRAEAAKNPKLQAVIAADQSLAYGRVVALIDLIKTHGVRSFALNIQPTAAAPAEARADQTPAARDPETNPPAAGTP